jgi:hypothetical protein
MDHKSRNATGRVIAAVILSVILFGGTFLSVLTLNVSIIIPVMILNVPVLLAVVYLIATAGSEPK